MARGTTGMKMRAGGILALAGLSACRAMEPSPARPVVSIAAPPAQREWIALLDEADRARIAGLAQSWRAALAARQPSRPDRRAAAERPLLDPAAALPRPELPPGAYHCRIVTLARGVVTRQGPYFCHVGVQGSRLWFAQQTGAGDRPGGYLYADGDQRAVFVGAAARGREQVPPSYGTDAARNVVGVVERIGPFRYRLVLARGEAGVTAYELTPSL